LIIFINILALDLATVTPCSEYDINPSLLSMIAPVLLKNLFHLFRDENIDDEENVKNGNNVKNNNNNNKSSDKKEKSEVMEKSKKSESVISNKTSVISNSNNSTNKTINVKSKLEILLGQFEVI
jgi:hypothetical protein